MVHSWNKIIIIEIRECKDIWNKYNIKEKN
jgi:hypothetical protein